MPPVLAETETNGIFAAMNSTRDRLEGSLALCIHKLKCQSRLILAAERTSALGRLL